MSAENGESERNYTVFEENIGDIEEEVVESYLENSSFQETVQSGNSPEDIVRELEEGICDGEEGQNNVKKAGKFLGYASNGAAALFGVAYAATTGPVGLSVAATGICGIEYMRRVSAMDEVTAPGREYLSARVSEDLEVEEISDEDHLYRLELEPEYDDSELLERERQLDYSPL